MTTLHLRPVTDTQRYRVTPKGYRQIAQWMVKHCTDATWNRLLVHNGVTAAVYAWADDAENSQDGEIEMSGRKTWHGLPAYLVPERVAVEE